MSDKSLWGDLSNFVPERTPSLVLQEQANLLEKATNEILRGRADRLVGQDGTRINASLEIVAPSLNNYSLEIVSLSYSVVSVYPVRVRDRVSSYTGSALSEDELSETLQKIFTSEEVRSLLSSLMAESQHSLKA